MRLLPSVRRPRAASILPLLVLLAACDDPSGTEAEDRPIFLAAGGAHACAVTESGAGYCWGSNTHGQLGNGTIASSAAPVRVDAPERLVSISAADEQSCAAGASGTAYCWGAITHGDPPFAEARTPSRVETEIRFVQVSAGLLHACGLTAAGRAHCWGSYVYDALGDGRQGVQWAPTPVPVNLDVPLASIGATVLSTCGLATTARAYCWGANLYGVFGSISTYVPRPTVVGDGLRFTSFDATATWACGVQRGDAYCWGLNRAGELGRSPISTAADSRVMAVAGLPAVERVFTARQNSFVGHACALTEVGEAWCWGLNTSGEAGVEPSAPPTERCQTGPIDVTCTTRPVRVAGALRFRTLAMGSSFTCGITRDGEIHCWGRATEGQLGPAGVGGPAPVRVELPES